MATCDFPGGDAPDPLPTPLDQPMVPNLPHIFSLTCWIFLIQTSLAQW